MLGALSARGALAQAIPSPCDLVVRGPRGWGPVVMATEARPGCERRWALTQPRGAGPGWRSSSLSIPPDWS